MHTEPTSSQHAHIPEFYQWQVPGKAALSVHLSLDLVERLNEEHLRCLKHEPQVNLQGVLIGHITYRPDPAVFIEDYELLTEGEEAPGATSQSSLERAFGRRIAKWSRDGLHQRYAVGFFRSQRAGWLSLSDSDLKLARKHFSDPENVALLVRFSEARINEGAFFIWEQGNIVGSQSYREFPFDVERLSAENRVRAQAAARQQAQAQTAQRLKQPPSQPQTSRKAELVSSTPANLPMPHPRAVREPIRWTKLLPTALLAAAAVGTLRAGLDSMSTPHKSAPAPIIQAAAYQPLIDLKVDLEAHQVNVKWNHASPVVVSAENGELTILDGPRRHVIRLDRNQLRDTNIVYQPVMDELNIRLEVNQQGGKSVGESVIVLAKGAGRH
jgi:hypothetical protein